MTIHDIDLEITKTKREKAEALRALASILDGYVKNLDTLLINREFKKAEAQYETMKRFLKRRERLFNTLNRRLLRLRDEQKC